MYVNVIDQNGCSISESFSLTNPDSIVSVTNSTGINCFGGNNGSASVSVINGGIAPFNYLWSNGQTTQTTNGLTAGTYSCVLTDANGCIDSVEITLIEPNEITNTITTIDASCYDECDGSMTVNSSGGTPPYTYNWNSGQSSQTITGLCAGMYNVTTTDSNSCSTINSAIINEPNPLIINIWINGSSLVATSGFVSYQWYSSGGILIPGETSEIFNPTSSDGYYVVVTDTNNCEGQSYVINYTINELNNITQKIKIYPNPTNGLVMIEGISAIKNITVINSIGNQLLQVENNNYETSSTKLDLSTFTKGIYFIRIEENNQIANYRIVLQ